jgi:hypothetical protein
MDVENRRGCAVVAVAVVIAILIVGFAIPQASHNLILQIRSFLTSHPF